jgi:heptosyltransferase-2
LGFRQPPLSNTRSILVIRPDDIGDIVLTVPFLRELRRFAPRARITLVVRLRCRELVETCPYVDEVYALNFPPNGGVHRLFLFLDAWRLRWSRLPLRGFDLVLLPRCGVDYYQAESVAYLLAGRGKMIIHRGMEVSSSLGDLADTGPRVECSGAAGPDSEHEVGRNIEFLRRCGAEGAKNTSLELWLTDSDRKFAREALRVDHRYVAFGTGAQYPFRRWPIKRFSDVAIALREKYGIVPVIIGANGDPKFHHGVDLVGQTTLRQAAAVLENCELYVGNDSGPKHLAAAMGTPVVEISGFRVGGNTNHNNSPTRFRALGVPHRLAQPGPGVGEFAIEEVSSEYVLQLCADLLTQVAHRPTLPRVRA